jgi:hypothetical protein
MRAGAMLLLIVGLFGVVRALALRNDLWMDEIWTLWHLSQLRSVGEVFSRFVHDNNHPLNTLWMYLMMPLKVDWAYRLLSGLGGTAGIWLAAKIARTQLLQLQPNASPSQVSAAELITALLFGSSYLLIVYSSEARGYGPALGFGLLAVYALLRGPTDCRSRWVIVYWLASLLSVLAHAVSYQLIAAGAAFTMVGCLQQKYGQGPAWSALVRWHAVPIASGVLYYILFIRHLEIIGGPETPLISVLAELAAYSIGIPGKASMMLALPLLLGGVIVALMRVWRRSRALACFYIVGMIGFPAAALSFTPFIYLFPRYFILSAALALLLIGYLAAVAWNAGRISRWSTIVATGLVLAGNLAHTVPLFRHGRGEYRAALRYIAAHTPAGPITICSDHDGRNVLLIYHHGPPAVHPRSLEYIPRHELPAEGAQWLFVHRLDHTDVPPSDLLDDRGNPYRLEKIFRHAPLSGWDWYVYRSRRLLPASE